MLDTRPSCSAMDLVLAALQRVAGVGLLEDLTTFRLRAELHEPEPICPTDRESDVHDIAGLGDLHSELFA